MKSLNIQPQGFPVGGEQFFNQQQQIETGSQHMFSPQMKQARLVNQQQTLAGISGIQHSNLGNNQEMSNNYMVKQKLESLQNISNNTNAPPGLNILQQQQQQGGAPGLNRAMNNQIPKQLNVTGVGNQQPTNMSHNVLPPPNHLFIRDVWKGNLHSEFVILRRMVQQYNQISISTEFVGTLARPIGNFRSKTDYHYQTMRSNVDFLNPIQIGISICDINGKKPDNGPSSWQFNFCFDTNDELISADSLELLKKSGIDFENHKVNGIANLEFAQLMMDSGLILEKSVTWITFHAAYDFGFLIHLLMNDIMPNNIKDFEWWVSQFIPQFYDLSLIYKVIHDFKEQLQSQQQQQQLTLASLADELGFPRFPLFATTGGQSLLTLLVFSQLGNLSMHKLPNGADFTNYKNLIYGITSE